jgi:polar amino acid transport system permease protein
MTTPAAKLNTPQPLIAARRSSFPEILFNIPWWFLVIVVAAIWVVVLINSDENYNGAFNYIRPGITETLVIAAVSYPLAMLIGLLIGLIRANPPKPGHGLRGRITAVLRLIVFQAATLYVNFIRGLPILVALLVVGFLVVPALRNQLSTIGVTLPNRIFRETAIVALAIAYGAFLSETFRAGIQSIERGQIEAARSLGMTNLQVISHIVLPQAFRRILPPLGNDFVAMIKDTSLVAALGVNDVTQLSRQWANNQFQFEQAYFTLAVIYLTLTITGSLVVRFIENRLSIPGR